MDTPSSDNQADGKIARFEFTEAEERRIDQINRVIDAVVTKCEKALSDPTARVDESVRYLKALTPVLKTMNDTMLEIRKLEVAEARVQETKLKRLALEKKANKGRQTQADMLAKLLSALSEMDPIRREEMMKEFNGAGPAQRVLPQGG